MAKKYYIFHGNSVVHDAGEVPRPCNEQELARILAGSPVTAPLTVKIADAAYGVDLPAGSALPPGYLATPLRQLLGVVEDAAFQDWGRAFHLLHWRLRTRFCGGCGEATSPHPTELARRCGNCEAVYYPTIAPCIIVLVHRREEILLARSPRFPTSMYSTLAGFIEPGESAEEALEREIYEEVGLEVDRISYFKSQPWPFPGQLMLGFFARHRAGTLTIDNEEICAAGWYTADRLPQIPSPQTIAGQLIRTHLATLGRE